MAKKIPDIIHDEEVDHNDKFSSIFNNHLLNQDIGDNVLNAINVSIEEELARQSLSLAPRQNRGFCQPFEVFKLDDMVVVKDKMMGSNFIGRLVSKNASGSQYFVKPTKNTKLEIAVWASVISTTQSQYCILRKATTDEIHP